MGKWCLLGFGVAVFGLPSIVHSEPVLCLLNHCSDKQNTTMPVDKLRCIIEGEIGILDYDDNGNPPKRFQEWTDICGRVARVAVCRRHIGDHGGINCQCPQSCDLAGEAKRRWEQGGKECAERVIREFGAAPNKREYCKGNYFFYLKMKDPSGNWKPFGGYMTEDLWKNTENNKRVICHEFYNPLYSPTGQQPKFLDVCVGFPDLQHPKE